MHAGIEGASADQRFNATLGDMADKVSRVQVGNLSTSLHDLSLKMGTVPSATDNAAASIYQMGINAGLTKEQAAKTTDQVAALAARSVALKPSLGDVSTVMEQLGLRLSRGGIAAQRLNISLDSNAISLRAMSDTGKTAVKDLQPFEKTVAAAELATEKYGGTLDQVITKGSKNAEITQRRLNATMQNTLEQFGKPLVAPFFDLVQVSLPLVQSLADILSTLGQAVFPTVTFAAKALQPPLQVLNDVIQALGPAIAPMIDAWLAYKTATAAVGAINTITSLSFDEMAAKVGIDAGAMSSGFGSIFTESVVADEGMTAAAVAATAELSPALTVATARAGGLAGSLDAVGLSSDQASVSLGAQSAAASSGTDPISELGSAASIAQLRLSQFNTGAKDAGAGVSGLASNSLSAAGGAASIKAAYQGAGGAVSEFSTASEIAAAQSAGLSTGTSAAMMSADGLAVAGADAGTGVGAMGLSMVGAATAVAALAAAVYLPLKALGFMDDVTSGVDTTVQHLSASSLPSLTKEFHSITPFIDDVNRSLATLSKGAGNEGIAKNFTELTHNAHSFANEAGIPAGTMTSFDTATAKLLSLNDQVKKVAETSPTMAKKLVEAATAAKLPAGEIDKLNSIVAKATKSFVEHTTAQKDLQAAQAKDAQLVQTQTFDINNMGSVVDATTDKIRKSSASILDLNSSIDAAATKLPSLSSAFSDALKGPNVQTPFGINPAAVGQTIQSLNNVTSATGTFFVNLKTVMDRGQTALADSLLQLGPNDLGARAAAQLAADQPFVAQGWTVALQGIANANVTIDAHLAQAKDKLKLQGAAMGQAVAEGYAQSEFGKSVLQLTDTEIIQLAAHFQNAAGPVGDAARTMLKGALNSTLAEANQFNVPADKAVQTFLHSLADPSAQAQVALGGAQLAGAAVKGAGDVSGQFFGLGQNAGQGFASGLSSKAAYMADVARGAVAGVTDAFANALGIKSPSKVMFAIGQNVGDGFALGMLSKTSTVGSAAHSLLGTFASSVPGFSGAGAAIVPNTAGPGFGGLTILINGHVYGDSHLQSIVTTAFQNYTDEQGRVTRAGQT